MKKLILLVLALTMLISISSCTETDDIRPELDLDTPPPASENPLEDMGGWMTDPTGTFSYLVMQEQGDTRPYVIENIEFPDNRFIYETIIDSLHDVKMYGYMDIEFNKLSQPVSTEPNIFFNGLAWIETEERSYIVDKDFNEMDQCAPSFTLFEDAFIEVTWRKKPVVNPYIITGVDPDKYLVPYWILPTTENMLTSPVYGFKTLKDAFSKTVAAEDGFVIDAMFEWAGSFHEGLAAVQLDGKWGYIDTDGNVVIDIIYDNASKFAFGYSSVYATQKQTTSDEGYDKEYDYIKCAVIDASGNLLTEFEYNYILPLNENVAFAVFDGSHHTAHIRPDGELISGKTTLPNIIHDFHDGFTVTYSGGNTYLDENGNLAFGFTFKSDRDFSDGLAAVKRSTRGKWEYINTSGETVIPAQFIYAFDFSQGFAMVYEKYNSPAYLIDKQGNKYLEELNLKKITKFNDDGYALAYSEVALNESAQDTFYYMIRIERPVGN